MFGGRGLGKKDIRQPSVIVHLHGGGKELIFSSHFSSITQYSHRILSFYLTISLVVFFCLCYYSAIVISLSTYFRSHFFLRQGYIGNNLSTHKGKDKICLHPILSRSPHVKSHVRSTKARFKLLEMNDDDRAININ